MEWDVLMASCKDCIHNGICIWTQVESKLKKVCKDFKNKSDFVEVVRCKKCKYSSEPKQVSRLELYSKNYDVCFCEKEQKIVCGTHFCGYGERSET